ncbi:MAG: pyridoxamine 5'-phosphate oxidase [Crocinitomicaceae bacterium]
MSSFLDELRNDHRDFDSGKLTDFFPETPFELFEIWFNDAVKNEEKEPNALVLSTCDIDSLQPSSRVVYLKELVNNQFVFYTNYSSQKGRELELNANASMLFFWPGLQRQVRIDGEVNKIKNELSDAYFASRPRESQLGAWASLQSERLEERVILEQRFAELEKQFTSEVPRPEHWGGYALSPRLVEFWQGRPSRLHDRIVYEKQNSSWEIYRKNP